MDDIVHVESYHYSLNKKFEELCGDRVRTIRNENSFVMVLADGLGSGVKANILATLTSTILSELMTSGDIDLDEAVDAITQTLPECKDRGIAYSTFAILQIFYNGRARLVEFDTPKSIFFRNGKNFDYQSTERKIGNRLIRESTFRVMEDDYIILFSDGILHAGLGMILNFGWDHSDIVKHIEQTYRKGDSARIMTKTLLAIVNDLYSGLPGDDSTVAVAKIVKAKQARVMVGPPIDNTYDEKVVKLLTNASGKKIVCGGTTAQIVSRITGKEIIMDELISFESDVPPGAKIKGMDLVTEGVLTLGKAGEYLKECKKSQDYYDNFMSIEPHDSAMKLVRMLLEDCTSICFMVGRADNPAHSGIAYSTISLSGKIRLIERMAEHLIKLGKIVTIELY